MKKHPSLLVALLACVIALSAGCASTPEHVPQKETARADIEKITKVDIFYHPAEYSVVDAGGSSLSGLASFLGPIGTLAGAALDAGSKLTVAERATARSKEFTALIEDAGTPEITLMQAERLAERIRESGREVRLISVKRPLGKMSAMDASDPEAATADYMPDRARLVLRVTPGYRAESAMSSFQSVMTTAFVLRDAEGKHLVSYSLRKQDNGETYMAYEGLKEAAATAAASLLKDALAQADDVFVMTFDLAPVAH
ncbi:hypothetical protein FHW67_003694 [Herbaspirillum sp. Sphag1AN]|uniref:hypothetical protein n=1 Tax=unclassified Herbaspirillum TaxID=2624150 RepID=UPI001622DC6B|nr:MULTISPECIES: hypothetical protein [unclassified Herbaspirillum]MBB3214377.1 hypothetical protein [Herbaspirillum sp. Sphag1AN]MBB3247519.1 hypothetical protein [Herbaspirillum sp. Sphag64]